MRRVTDKTQLYTGKGDGGRTGLIGKQNVSKGSHRIDILGELDELSASLGLARALTDQTASKQILLAIQRDIYVLMSELAVSGKSTREVKELEEARVAWLESQINWLTSRSKAEKGFTIPGDTLASAALDVSRTIARRVERRVVRELDRGHKVGKVVLSYLNRVSSLLYALELHELNAQAIKPTQAKESTDKKVKK
ncbi:MAG: cob(I)yrinic acid a,c-diamide adenosyltransferase [Anaerolineaceae bacterium]|nr:cob(I)yrinic acid a,c-diamide adenosyltransferase [Anaerolineaceae bacterium]MBN2678312.1 cob(I)yrinic acid a,c-diamide adenosyltransferase [Anaerolineaceae bacterium]